MSSLNEKRDVLRDIPHKITAAEEDYIIKCRQQVPCYGHQRLQLFFGVERSEGAIKRILKEHRLTRTKRKTINRGYVHNEAVKITGVKSENSSLLGNGIF